MQFAPLALEISQREEEKLGNLSLILSAKALRALRLGGE
jgi:hypothetical protein